MSSRDRSKISLGMLCLTIAIIGYASGWSHSRYLGPNFSLASLWSSPGVQPDAHDHEAGDDHDHADHQHDDAQEGAAHGGHDEHAHGSEGSTDSIELSEAARKNLGLTQEYLTPVDLQTFQRTILVPAIVVDRPGRTRLPVSAAMTGIVTHVHAVSGETVQPGDLILEMRLTHEDLVSAQKDFLQSLGDHDIELKEIARLEQLANSGALSNKTLLERKYGRDKLESQLRSQREALRLHGLSVAQIERIENDRRLLTEIRITAPLPDDHSDEEIQLIQADPFEDLLRKKRPHFVSRSDPGYFDHQHDFESDNSTEDAFASSDSTSSDSTNDESIAVRNEGNLLVLQDLHVQKGQIVNAGDLLCTLADYGDLLIEGQAFEAEASLIAKAKLANWKLAAISNVGGTQDLIEPLELGWMNNEIDPASRILKFYVMLPNELLQDAKNSLGQRHIVWKYRTGQRMQLKVPVEQWVDQLVLPTDAVVREGIQSFVFQQNGDRFQRVEVHEKYRDQTTVVIENDGAVFPGDVIARKGAHQMQMAVKSKSGNAVDPHAGHQH